MKAFTITCLTIIALSFLIQDIGAQEKQGGVKGVVDTAKDAVKTGVEKVKEGAGKVVDAVKDKLKKNNATTNVASKVTAAQPKPKPSAGAKEPAQADTAKVEDAIVKLKKTLEESKEKLGKLGTDLKSLAEQLIKQIGEKLPKEGDKNEKKLPEKKDKTAAGAKS